MGTSILIVIVVGVFLAWWVYFRPINPSNKTDNQLWWMHRMAQRGAYRDLEVIEAEMKKRGLIDSENTTARPASGAPHLTQLQAVMLRNNALDAYEEGWKMAEVKWKDNQSARHQHALANVLLRRLQKEAGELHLSTELIEILNFEAIPFKVLDRDAGKAAIAEYVVWREYPDLANISTIRNAVRSAKSQGLDEVLDGVSRDKLGWLKWSELLDENETTSLFKLNPSNKTDQQLINLYIKAEQAWRNSEGNVFSKLYEPYREIADELEKRNFDLGLLDCEVSYAKYDNRRIEYEKCRITDEEKLKKQVLEFFIYSVNISVSDDEEYIHDEKYLPYKKDVIKKVLLECIKQETDDQKILQYCEMYTKLSLYLPDIGDYGLRLYTDEDDKISVIELSRYEQSERDKEILEIMDKEYQSLCDELKNEGYDLAKLQNYNNISELKF